MTGRLSGSVYSANLKRVLDLVASVALIVLGAPIQAAAAAAIVATDGFPVLFHQERTGRSGRTFQLHKLRTMRNGTEEKGGNFPTEDMVTPVGRVLRRLSVDELPQLINIVNGSMSFVGPRPALPSQVERYTDRQLQRLTVRPGITGLAQVRFRNNATWSRRIEADLEYIDRMSIFLDARIVLRTAFNVITGKDQVVGQTAADVDDLAQVIETQSQ